MAFPASLDTFTTLVDNTDDVLAAVPNARADSIEAIEIKLGIDSSAVATSIDYLLKNASSVDPGHHHAALDIIAGSGRKVWFYENAAPTGWSIVGVTDSVLAVKGGSQAYNVTGGQTAGTWTQPDHALTSPEMPIHAHLLGSQDSDAGTSGTPNMEFIRTYGDGNGPNATSSTTGGTDAHNHGTTYRPMACVGIICIKS